LVHAVRPWAGCPVAEAHGSARPVWGRRASNCCGCRPLSPFKRRPPGGPTAASGCSPLPHYGRGRQARPRTSLRAFLGHAAGRSPPSAQINPRDKETQIGV
jgi:hypothetical protein